MPGIYLENGNQNLLATLFTLKLSAKENEDLTVSNLRLTKMHNELHEGLENKCERTKRGKGEHTKLQSEY